MNYNFSSIKVLPMQLYMFSRPKDKGIQVLYSDHLALTMCWLDPSLEWTSRHLRSPCKGPC